ncbi:hypothetical protein VRK_28190 [Vibrio sp. MEBiC08052]|nr:hypothetical protein VRK_28190 [Vibrio sp. MEBiC08052]
MSDKSKNAAQNSLFLQRGVSFGVLDINGYANRIWLRSLNQQSLGLV